MKLIMIKIYILALLAPLFAAFGQVALKRYSVKSIDNKRPFKEFIVSSFFFGISALLGIFCMRYLEFSSFYSLTALNYVFIALLANWFLNEKFDRAKVIGSTITIAGLFVYNM